FAETLLRVNQLVAVAGYRGESLREFVHNGQHLTPRLLFLVKLAAALPADAEQFPGPGEEFQVVGILGEVRHQLLGHLPGLAVCSPRLARQSQVRRLFLKDCRGHYQPDTVVWDFGARYRRLEAEIAGLPEEACGLGMAPLALAKF